tara:strand:+ start:77 stop:1462 length:1386 start_codon:yes stop_codon:yes gene_type:complete
MYKKISIWLVIFVLLIIIIFTILFGSLLVHYYEYGARFPKIQKIAVSIASVPINFEKIIRFGNRLEPLKKIPTAHSERVGEITKVKKNNNGNYIKFYNKNLNSNRNELLILPRYDRQKQTSVVEIIDLSTLDVIHRYNHDIDNAYKDLNVGSGNTKKRFQYGHPLILDDGSLIAKNVMFSPLFKIDICGKDLWRNSNYKFHHSLELDHENNVWVTSSFKNIDDEVLKNISIVRNGKPFSDDAIIKINPKTGKVIFKKSVSAILLENNIFNDSDIYMSTDPIHLNDIQPVYEDGPFWKKGDVFLSLLRNSSIIHYRPETNQLINFIKGPFFEQHDIDILSENEISVFNNNNSLMDDNKFSELLVYNFETNKFKKILSNQLESKSFKTETEGLADFSRDGSIMLEETNGGRILFYNEKGNLEWEFINVSNDGKIYPISWARLISNVNMVKNIKNSIDNQKCSN